jgi:tRNA-splicing ligase RtcB
LSEPLGSEVKLALERLQRADDVQHIAIMPDVHPAGDVCNGCVIATRELLYPNAVGGDIGCGMAAMRFDCGAGLLADERAAASVLAGLSHAVPSIRHSRRTTVDLPEDLLGQELSDAHLNRLKDRDGRVQFATLGRGNHFLEFQSDDQGRLWVMLHTGSRAMGQAIRDHHLKNARRTSSGLKAIPAGEPAGAAYLSDAQWAISYACESRRAILASVAAMMDGLFGVQAFPDSVRNADHNHVRRETHDGQALWVHRKGAMFAGSDEPGLIPGSMGTTSFHVRGRGCEESLCSSSHGAGRTMSREQARRRIRLKDAERALTGVWCDRRRSSELIEESPAAYKDIHAVMRAQNQLTRIEITLTPVLCYKGY